MILSQANSTKPLTKAKNPVLWELIYITQIILAIPQATMKSRSLRQPLFTDSSWSPNSSLRLKEWPKYTKVLVCSDQLIQKWELLSPQHGSVPISPYRIILIQKWKRFCKRQNLSTTAHYFYVMRYGCMTHLNQNDRND